MGDNFSALIKYGGLNPAIDAVLSRLEAGGGPAGVARVVELGLVEDFAFARERYPGGWFALADCEQRLWARPGLPDVSVQRMLPSGFGIVLGADSVWIWHFLRWQFFCRDPRWRAVML